MKTAFRRTYVHVFKFLRQTGRKSMLDEAIEAYNKDQQEKSLFWAVMGLNTPVVDLTKSIICAKPGDQPHKLRPAQAHWVADQAPKLPKSDPTGQVRVVSRRGRGDAGLSLGVTSVAVFRGACLVTVLIGQAPDAPRRQQKGDPIGRGCTCP
ncbi:hypothetical protein PCANC_15929 [Puccinia coronata f. sp. avenae]|uniref:Uncharacterized protein n=1 Tax=Puccinia coronata f. sp. avenae TaxID=200324 RepID=A0A2N5SPK9_9BASI|nr:hypothetical protein PCANC_15929 [Puccinia coronata f. sp. avenae]